MLSKVKTDIEGGISKIKWFSSLLSERLQIEITTFKLLYKSEELKKQRDELLKVIGQEVYEMRGKDKNIYASNAVVSALKELEQLDPEIKETLEKVAEIGKITP